MNILKSVFNSFLPGAEKEIENGTLKEYNVTLYHIDGNSEVISTESNVEGYRSKYFIDNSNAVAVPFGKNSEMVLYDPYLTQPPTFYNPEASFQTQIDIYGPAIIFRSSDKDIDEEEEQEIVEKVATKKRKKKSVVHARRKSARLSHKNL